MVLKKQCISCCTDNAKEANFHIEMIKSNQSSSSNVDLFAYKLFKVNPVKRYTKKKA